MSVQFVKRILYCLEDTMVDLPLALLSYVRVFREDKKISLINIYKYYPPCNHEKTRIVTRMHS